MKCATVSRSSSIVLTMFAAVLFCISDDLATGQAATVLYSFGTSSSDGVNPFSGLIADKAGNLYGTTQSGGTFGGGTVFKLSPPSTTGGPWTETVLYSFTGGTTDGSSPEGGVIFDKVGNLYGTTLYGGTSSPGCRADGTCGTVFELTPPAVQGGTWTETVIHRFGNGSDGYWPSGGLVMDRAGDLFGTTRAGGNSGASCYEGPFPGCGTVYMLTPPAKSGGAWSETILHNFVGGSDGKVPQAGLLLKGATLYGTTISGGSVPYGGTVFQLTAPATRGGTWTENILHVFTGGNDGTAPDASLISDASGNLYGTTEGGGSYSAGTVFQLAEQSGGWVETVIYSFTGGIDGSSPLGPVLFDGAGNLYGATFGYYGVINGAIFKLTPPATLGASWTETTLYQFSGTNGANPVGPMVRRGVLYGTTDSGGSFGYGTVFSFEP